MGAMVHAYMLEVCAFWNCVDATSLCWTLVLFMYTSFIEMNSIYQLRTILSDVHSCCFASPQSNTSPHMFNPHPSHRLGLGLGLGLGLVLGLGQH